MTDVAGFDPTDTGEIDGVDTYDTDEVYVDDPGLATPDLDPEPTAATDAYVADEPVMPGDLGADVGDDGDLYAPPPGNTDPEAVITAPPLPDTSGALPPDGEYDTAAIPDNVSGNDVVSAVQDLTGGTGDGSPLGLDDTVATNEVGGMLVDNADAFGMTPVPVSEIPTDGAEAVPVDNWISEDASGNFIPTVDSYQTPLDVNTSMQLARLLGGPGADTAFMDEVGNNSRIDNGRMVVEAGDVAQFFAEHLGSWEVPEYTGGASGAPLEIDRGEATKLVHLMAGPIDAAQLEKLYDEVMSAPEGYVHVDDTLRMPVRDLADFIAQHVGDLGLGAPDAREMLSQLDAQSDAPNVASTTSAPRPPLPDDPPGQGSGTPSPVSLPIAPHETGDAWDSIAPLAHNQPVHLLAVVDGAVETATVTHTADDHIVARLPDSTEISVSREDMAAALEGARTGGDSGREPLLLAAGGALLVPAVVGAVVLHRRRSASKSPS